jgi:hypothetical protein
MDLTADQGLRLNAYSAVPGSPDQDALNLIASRGRPPTSEKGATGLTFATLCWLSTAQGPVRLRGRTAFALRQFRTSDGRASATVRDGSHLAGAHGRRHVSAIGGCPPVPNPDPKGVAPRAGRRHLTQ